MNLYFRLLFTLLRGFFRSPQHPLIPVNSRFRVMPWDIDALGHMNNGRYLQISDVARVDWMRRARILDAILKHRWHAVLGGSIMRYCRVLKPFQRYQVVTRVVSWDDRWFFIEHRFTDTAQRDVAICLTRAALRDRDGWVGTQRIIDDVVPGLKSPPHSDQIKRWLCADDGLFKDNSFTHIFASDTATDLCQVRPSFQLFELEKSNHV